MNYDIDISFEGERGATVDQFLRETADVNSALNESWAKVKAGIPADQQADAETKVRAVLKA